jgi:hypothetical protein
MSEKLNEYKAKLIQQSEGKYKFKQSKFIEDAFTRWYINSEKQDIFPKHNIAVRKDLEYANQKKNMEFNIDKFMDADSKIHKSIFSKKMKGESISDYRSITPWQFGRLQKIYSGNPKLFYKNINVIISLYEVIGMNSLHLSIPPVFKGVELFGSPLNTVNKEYCSLLEAEKDFGSLGSFWEYKFHKSGLYLCNPPFDEDIIYDMANHLNKIISSTKCKVTIIITVPVWDSETQKLKGLTDYGLDFPGLSEIKKSKFLVDSDVLGKTEFKYWNYYSENYIPACWTHLLLLTNTTPEITIPEFKARWQEAVKKNHKPDYVL